MRKNLDTKLKGWGIKQRLNEVEELVPMSFSEMIIFCLWSYLNGYEIIVCGGNFHSGSNVIQLVENIIDVFNSLASFTICKISYSGLRTVTMVEVSDKNAFREVCNNNNIIHKIIIQL